MGSIYRFTLDLHSTQSQVFIPVPKGDTAREWHISLSDGGVPYIIEDGSVATIEIKRPRGGILQYFCPIVNQRIVIYDFNNDDVTRSTATEDGIHECDILITSEKGEFASASFTMLVSDRVVNNVSLTQDDFNTLAAIRWEEGKRQTYFNNLEERVDAGEFNGKDYVLTDADRTEIAEKAASIMPKEVVNITTIDETYETVADLPTDKGEGTTLLVLSEKSLYSYNSTAKAWEFKSALKPHTVYCVLEGEKAGLYRFTMTSPYLVSVESHTLQEAKDYTDDAVQNVADALERYQKQFAGTKGLAYDLVTDHYRLEGLGDVPDGSHIEIGSFVNGYPVTEIASNAFPNNTIKSIRVPATINKFGNNAFGRSGKVDTVFVDNIAKWAVAMFEVNGSPVTTETKKIYIKDVYSDTLTIPEGVTKISQRAFMHWKQFKSILLPESLEEICETAFQYCSGLETLTIPAGVKSVGLAAIDRCASLKTVLFEGKPESMESSVFAQDTALTDIYVKWGKDEIPGAPWAAPNATVWYYSENQPTDLGNYWHYVDGEVTNWKPVYKETEGLAFISPGVGYYPICIGIGSATTEDFIVIPEMAGGDPVKDIGVAAFADALNVTTVVLPPFLETAYGGSLSSPSIKKVVVRKHPYGAHDDANNSWVYSTMFTSPNNELHYSDTRYINDGASAFCPVELEDYSGGSWSEVYVSTTGANTTLEELHVPWAEDHEWMNANRPWGLENATIIYESEESMV